MYLYPRLRLFAASELARTRARMPLNELRTASRDLKHPAVWFAPTGGNRVSEEKLRDLQARIRERADLAGWPDSRDGPMKQRFDAECAVALLENMGSCPSEASSLEVWYYMTCILLPDVVRWRFPGAGEGATTAEERFLGGDRGLRRNTFGRLWWRAYLLCQLSAEQPYRLLNELYEDELVQITERPSLACSPALATQLCVSFLQAAELVPKVARRELIRDAVKRVRRLLPIVQFDLLDDRDLGRIVDDVFLASAAALSQSDGG